MGSGQLYILLWKNFQWCKRHPFKTALFYLLPILFCLFLPLVYKEIKLEDKEDCDYETIALPPSHPLIVVQSIVCSRLERCVRQGFYEQPSKTPFWVASEQNDTMSGFCPHMRLKQAMSYMEQQIGMTCGERDDSIDEGRQLMELDALFRGRLFYTPNTGEAAQLIQIMSDYLDQIDQMRYGAMLMGSVVNEPIVRGAAELASVMACYQRLQTRTLAFDSRDAAVAFAKTLNFSTDGVWAVLDLTDLTSNTTTYNMITHYNMRYETSSLILQALLESSIIQLKTGQNQKNSYVLQTKRLPQRCYKDPTAYDPVLNIVFTIMSLGMIPLAQAIASEIAYEKAAGLVEFLLIQGVSRTTNKLSWYLFALFFTETVLLLISIVIYVSNSLLFEYTSFTIWWLTLVLYGLALIGYCFTWSSALSTPQRASMVMFLLLLAGFLLPGWAQLVPEVGYTGGKCFVAILFSLLHPTAAVSIACGYIFSMEKLELGIQANKMGASPLDTDDFGGLITCWIIMIIQSIGFILLSFYFDFVAPSKYGVHRPWYFFVQPRFWTGSSSKEQIDADIDMASMSHHPGKTGILLRGLTKQYNAKNPPAVSDLTVDFNANEITALLGHNGAGKSTTMNMLTGMIEPTRGTALIGGLDINEHMDTIRSQIAYCPQYDIIYRELTTDEHMKFYGYLKNIPFDQVMQFTDRLFDLMKMDGQARKKTMAKDLSGGMKRKLSIAIAFLGTPEVVILDEPTSAIDPFSRRAIWDVVLASKHNTTILLSTHYMTEADILADQIAIVNHGKLVAHGTAMDLKAKYGSGATLKIAHADVDEGEELDVDELYKQLCTIVPELEKKSATNQETQFVVPRSSIAAATLADVSRYLEEHRDEHHIASFGISESTLEHVFFKVASDYDELDPDALSEPEPQADTDTKLEQAEPAVGCAKLGMHLLATWLKRWYITKRSKLGFVFQVLMPLVFICILLFLNNVVANASLSQDLEQIQLWPNLKLLPNEILYAGDYNSPWAQSVFGHGLGTPCATGLPQDRKCDRTKLNTPTTQFASLSVESESTSTCACNQCPADANAPLAPRYELATGDIISQLWTSRNVTQYALRFDKQTKLLGAFEVYQEARADATSLAAAVQNVMPDVSARAAVGELLDPTLSEMAGRYYDIDNIQAINVTHLQIPGVTTLNMSDSAQMASFGSRLSQILTNAFSGGSQEVFTIWAGKGERGMQSRRANRVRVAFSQPAGMLNAHNNVLAKTLLSALSIVAYNEEVQMTNDWTETQVISGVILGMFASLALLMPIMNVLLVIVSEFYSGNRQLQLLMGLNRWMFWLANFVWDLVLYTVSVALVLLMMAIFPDDFKIDRGFFFLAAMLFGCSMIVLAYALAYTHMTPRSAALLVGCASTMFTFTAMILLAFYEKKWFKTVNGILCFFPPYFFTYVIIEGQLTAVNPMEKNKESLVAWDNMGAEFFTCFMFFVVFVIIIVALDLSVVARCLNIANSMCRSTHERGSKVGSASASSQDPDVAREEEEILQKQGLDDRVLLVERLKKQFGNKKVAVNNLTFGVYKGECFGLLGVNGAGKSTTFKMLTGYEHPTHGDARVMEHSIFTNQAAVAQHMSYCPQTDVLFESLTPEEHLNFYGLVRSLDKETRERQAAILIDEIGLDPHRKKQSQQLSGGNKRKLNFAISMLNLPAVLFLDEMTTGMDPRARAATWKVLQKAVAYGSAAVITSHSMEECEALCHRLAIMVNGAFTCLGGVQYLKDKFGNNYNIKLHLSGSNAETHAQTLESIMNELRAEFESVQLCEQHIGYLEATVPVDENLRLSKLFDVITQIKLQHGVHEFSVSQTTLEHVFVGMVHNQH